MGEPAKAAWSPRIWWPRSKTGSALGYVHYCSGVDTQLNALDAGRGLFQALLTLAQIGYAEWLSVVQLYKALGGGWE